MNANSEKRKPLLSDKRMRGYEGSPTIMDLINVENRSMDREQVRDFYESLLDDGTLIRRADLLRWADGISLDYSHNADFQRAMDLLTDHISKPRALPTDVRDPEAPEE